MTLHIPFDNSYARLPEGFSAPQKPMKVARPSLIAFNEALAADLQISGGEGADLAGIFAGNTVPEGAAPLAQLYSGHQFGQYNPQLGDGRAILLGEVIDLQGTRRDIQLKGSGPTPFSRRGDGRAWLGPVLREYVVSEAMHALGVPTTRALAATRTGEEVFRDTPLPGAVLTRTAASHIRVGTFQIFSARKQWDKLQTLYDYTVARHYPHVTSPTELLQEVIKRQAALVAQWMSFGFIHGVMNTDNCTLSGETIDYGPCAFLDAYDPNKVFSSIDRYGRYAYAAQADVIVWNMAQLATALVPLVEDTDAAIKEFTDQIHAMPDLIRQEWVQRFGRKLGISDADQEDAELIGDFLNLIQRENADFTNSFRALTDGTLADHLTHRADFDAWSDRWQARRSADATEIMAQSNPVIIPRNHQIEAMIQAAVDGDDAPFHRLNTALAAPFSDNPDFADLRQPPEQDEVVEATFCGT